MKVENEFMQQLLLEVGLVRKKLMKQPFYTVYGDHVSGISSLQNNH
jgi:hypothetical protein